MPKTYIVEAARDGVKCYGLILSASSRFQALLIAQERLPEQYADCLLSVTIYNEADGCKGCEEALFADDICPDCGNFAGVN